MHLGNGAITTECALVTLIAAGTGVGMATWNLRRKGLTTEQKKLAIGLSGMIFAAQAVNVSVGDMSSAHLVGGAILAMLLGSSAGIVAMSIILAIQALLVGDGGLASLGANIVNMALIPALLVELSERYFAAKSPSHVAQMIRGGLVAAAAVVVVAVLIPAEVALGRSTAELQGLTAFTQQMLTSHLIVAVAEGTITAMVLALVAIPQRSSERVPSSSAVATSSSSLLLTLAVAVAFVVASPWGSGLPDGYEHAAEANGMARILEESPEQLAASGTLATMAASVQAKVLGVLQPLARSEQFWLAMTTIAAMVWMGAATLLAASKQSQPQAESAARS